MDISDIDRHLQLLQIVGYTLNVEQRLQLRLAQAQLLQAHPGLDELQLWGRIQGVSKNYYIILGLSYHHYQFPHKTFFWASENFKFQQLPELMLQHQGLADKHNMALFWGDPSKVLQNLEGDGEAEGDEAAGQAQENQEQASKSKMEEEEEQDIKNEPKKNFTELNRLSYVVRAIQNEAHCVPKSSYKMTPEHQLKPNSNFYGLDETNGCSLSNWLHFRSPQSNEARRVMQEDFVVFNSGFLDQISKDLPKGCWSIQLDPKAKHVSARSLLWPGYYAIHKLKSELFSSFYVGNGIKNVDLHFLL